MTATEDPAALAADTAGCSTFVRKERSDHLGGLDYCRRCGVHAYLHPGPEPLTVEATGEPDRSVEWGVQSPDGTFVALGVVDSDHATELVTDPTGFRYGWTPVRRTVTTIRGPWHALADTTEPTDARGGEHDHEGASPA